MRKYKPKKIRMLVAIEFFSHGILIPDVVDGERNLSLLSFIVIAMALKPPEAISLSRTGISPFEGGVTFFVTGDVHLPFSISRLTSFVSR